MSNENPNNSPPNERRGSVTSAAFSNLFQRSNSLSGNSTGNGSHRKSVTAVAAQDQRRRLSVTTLGLSGTSPPTPGANAAPFGIRRGSISTNNSDSIDECAVEDDEPAKAPPTSPFARRTSFGAQAMRTMQTGQTSPGSGMPTQQLRRTSTAAARVSPPTVPSISATSRRMSTSQASQTLSARSPSDMLSARPDNGYNWTEQLRYRAESLAGQRPNMGSAVTPGSPPRAAPQQHDRARSVSDMPAPPRQPEVMKPRQPERPKPDYMQERILKGDFYMD